MPSNKARYEDIINGYVMLNNRYRVKNVVGVGGISTVYDVDEIYSEYFNDIRQLVIKIPSAKISKKKDSAAFAYSEYALMRDLHHPNIVNTVDFGIDDETNLAYIIFEKIDGNLLSNISLFDLDSKMHEKLMFSLCSAIKYIHDKGIVHADINPTNVMISKDEDVKLFDFGISLNHNANQDFNLSYSKVKAYNPKYTAPEVLNGDVEPSFKSDLFSLACLMYEIYNGTLPFSDSSLELLEKPIRYQQLLKIPFLQRFWFIKALAYNYKERTDKFPLSLSLMSNIKK
jgi:serine/threonine protein kinase